MRPIADRSTVGRSSTEEIRRADRQRDPGHRGKLIPCDAPLLGQRECLRKKYRLLGVTVIARLLGEPPRALSSVPFRR